MHGCKRAFRKPVMVFLAVLFLYSSYCSAKQVREEEGADLVARITVIEGRLERFDPETEEWIVTVPDAPVGANDQLYAGSGVRAEILIPNNTLMRIGEEAEVRFVALTEQLTEIDLFSGTARLCNNSSGTDISAVTSFGRISVPPRASVDVYIGENSVEILSLDGSAHFIDDQSGVRHEIIAGSPSLLVFSNRIMPGSGSVNRGWNAWNSDRDALWAERRRIPGESRDYLPLSLHDEAYILNTFGSWHSVYYENDYYRFWRPRHVDIGWSPFSAGMWTTWRGDRVWIPREPFGYVTHHYGNWVHVQGTWYWAPPVSRTIVRMGFPLLNIGFCWYPGRVAWIDAGISLRWIPLAPFEPFYCRYPWGYRTVVIGNGPYPRYVASHNFKYRRHTVMGRQDHFYRNRKGSHNSKWRTENRSGGRVSPVPESRDRLETRGYRSARDKDAGNRYREERKPEEGSFRGGRNYSGTRTTIDHDGGVVERRRNPSTEQNRSQHAPGITQRSLFQNRSGVNRMDRDATQTKTSESAEGRNNNRNGSKNSEGSRESIAMKNNGTVPVLPEKSPRFSSPSVERKSNPVNDQNRLQPSPEKSPRFEVQQRTRSVHAEKNTFRNGNRTYRPR